MAYNAPATKCTKGLIFVLNVMFLIVATVLLCLGIKFYISYTDLEAFLETPYFSPAGITITVAVILLLVSLLGYVAATKQSVCLLNIYSFTLTILLVLEIAAAITAFIISNKTFTAIERNMINGLREYKSSPTMQRAWDVAQQDLYCCGVYRPFDWASEDINGATVTLNHTTFKVPFSCCVHPRNCAERIYASGCWNVLRTDISGASKVLGYSVVNIAVLQLVGIVFSSMLAKYLRRAKSLEEMERQKALSNSLRLHQGIILANNNYIPSENRGSDSSVA